MFLAIAIDRLIITDCHINHIRLSHHRISFKLFCMLGCVLRSFIFRGERDLCRMTMNLEWECGLLRPEELTPLSQSLIPQELGCAFNIPSSSSASTCKAATPLSSDVLNSSQSAFDSLHCMRNFLPPSIELDQMCKEKGEGPTIQGTPDDVGKVMTGFIRPDREIHQHAHLKLQGKVGPFMAGGFSPSSQGQDQKSVLGHGQFPTPDRVSSFTVSLYSHIPKGPGVVTSVPDVASGNGDLVHGVYPEATSLMQLRVDPSEEVDSGPSVDRLQSAGIALSNEGQSAARTLKKPRLVWTPQLHKRFVDAVAHLGIKNAVPKSIMQLMNVDGLTRENVASHLQKYRLYLKRIQGLSTEGPSSSDHLFASTPIPAGLAASTDFLVSNQTQQHVNLHSPSTLGGTVLHPILGNRARRTHVLPHLGLPTPSILKFDTRPTLMPVPTLTPITSTSECMRERYSQCGSSTPPGSILTLFPTKVEADDST